MQTVLADLHVHIGTAAGRRVKVTASRDLTLQRIVRECAEKKGIGMVGVVDCCSNAVMSEMEAHVASGLLQELEGGGLLYDNKVTLIPGCETEAVESWGAPAHYVCYFPRLAHTKRFSDELHTLVTNADLSSQRCFAPAQRVWAMCEEAGGFMVPAHAFTPHRSIFGSAARRLSDVFDERALASIPAIELGLSADSEMADHIGELAGFTFLSNSDAHSPEKIAREYNALEIGQPTYAELLMALRREKGRRVSANYGLDPRLGKYHRTSCLVCQKIASAPPPVLSCDACGSEKVVKGVLDRLVEIQDRPEARPPQHRPPYVHQIPLQFTPGIGPVAYAKLLQRFGTEMAVLHSAPQEELALVVGRRGAATIVAARLGRLPVIAGGGGRYGRAIGSAGESQMNFDWACEAGTRD
jgi:uncharacterized protein (TIGR00375 family)